MRHLSQRTRLLSATFFTLPLALSAAGQVGQVKYPPPPQPTITVTRTPTGLEARSTLEVLNVSVCQPLTTTMARSITERSAEVMTNGRTAPGARG